MYQANKQLKQLKKKVTSLKQIISDCKKNNLLSTNALEHISHLGDVPSAIIKRAIRAVNAKTTPRTQIPEELRKFAFTLYFYSPKAYNYVRNTFHLALPNLSTIRSWKTGVSCVPGFTSAAFAALKRKSEEAKNNEKRIICSLMLDEMSIKKQIDYDGTRVWGYTDIGINSPSEESEPATEVLVLMVVSVNAAWKIPIGYFLIKGMTGEEKAALIEEALIRLNDIEVEITSITCDGPSVNFTMFSVLGCNFGDINSLKVFFYHPSDRTKKVYAIFDTCHMLKLARNCLATNKVLIDGDGNYIKWSYIEKLFQLQADETLNLANKLSKNHILNWTKLKMKVKY